MTATDTTTANIAPQLEALAVPMGELALLEGNPRKGDVKAIARSLKVFGQRKPVVANRDGVIEAGNHTWQAAQELGWDRLAVVFVDDDPVTAHAYALADNRTAELGGYDEAALATMVSRVHAADAELLAATGYTGDDVQNLLDRMAAEANGGDGADKGALLDRIDVTVGEPHHQPQTGSVWHIGDHVLVVADLMTQHQLWAHLLTPDTVFVPYPGPFVALATNVRHRMVMVQPDPYLAGHLLDKYVSIHGADAIAEVAA